MVQKNTPRTHASTANDGDMEHMGGGGGKTTYCIFTLFGKDA